MKCNKYNLLRLFAFQVLLNTSDKIVFINAYRFITGENGGKTIWFYMYRIYKDPIYNELKDDELR